MNNYALTKGKCRQKFSVVYKKSIKIFSGLQKKTKNLEIDDDIQKD